MGSLGAARFWQRYNSDPIFRQSMHHAWTHQHVNRSQKIAAARNGAAAFWTKYHSDSKFKEAMDLKLGASRSRGGSASLLAMTEDAFKRMLTTSAKVPELADLPGRKREHSQEQVGTARRPGPTARDDPLRCGEETGDRRPRFLPRLHTKCRTKNRRSGRLRGRLVLG